MALAGEDVAHQAELNPVQNSSAGESTAETREHGENPTLPLWKPCLTCFVEHPQWESLYGNMLSFLAVSDGPPSSSDQQNETAPFKLEATVPSRLALGARCGYSQRCWGSPVRQKKKHTGKHCSFTQSTD